MADFKVTLESNNSNLVKVDSDINFNVSQERTIVAEFLSDLADVSVSNLPAKNQYVLTYDATISKYVLVPADQVLSSAAADAQLPADFEDVLDVDLDNRIDVDAGKF
jgi:hypothetical protein